MKLNNEKQKCHFSYIIYFHWSSFFSFLPSTSIFFLLMSQPLEKENRSGRKGGSGRLFPLKIIKIKGFNFICIFNENRPSPCLLPLGFYFVLDIGRQHKNQGGRRQGNKKKVKRKTQKENKRRKREKLRIGVFLFLFLRFPFVCFYFYFLFCVPSLSFSLSFSYFRNTK